MFHLLPHIIIFLVFVEKNLDIRMFEKTGDNYYN